MPAHAVRGNGLEASEEPATSKESAGMPFEAQDEPALPSGGWTRRRMYNDCQATSTTEEPVKWQHHLTEQNHHPNEFSAR